MRRWNPYEPKELCMRVRAVVVCLMFLPPSAIRRSKTYVEFWKHILRPLLTTDLSDGDLETLLQRFKRFWSSQE